jgi:ferritin-like metal-binding protein YciE
LPTVIKHANAPKLAVALRDAREQADAAIATLAETGRHEGGARNLWMAGIADDARRDTRSVERGPLLDAAIIGAIRKAKAAQIVSYDTAIAVAAALRQVEIEEAMAAIRKAAVTSNRRLGQLLPRAD